MKVKVIGTYIGTTYFKKLWNKFTSQPLRLEGRGVWCMVPEILEICGSILTQVG
jgi:hypothetical protein